MRVYPLLTVDEEFKSLGDLGFSGTLNDRQFAFLRGEGHTGSLPDMLKEYFDATNNQGDISNEIVVEGGQVRFVGDQTQINTTPSGAWWQDTV